MSVSSGSEYRDRLLEIADENLFHDIVLNIPASEPIYEVDLDKRTIKCPDFLSVSTDHDSETVYFKFNRYYDNVDLSQTTCIIQFINANNQGALYPVPYCDTTTLASEGKMIIPWSISGLATAAPGTIQFSIRFFIADEDELIYNLNTQIAKSKILYGMDLSDEMIDIDKVDASVLEQIYWALHAFGSSNAWDWIEDPRQQEVNQDSITLATMKQYLRNRQHPNQN